MPRRKALKALASLFSVGFLAILFSLPAVTGPPAPLLDCPSYVLMDPDTGRVIYGRHIETTRAPASTTKIMTALLAVENADLDSIVTVTSRATWESGSRLGLEAGEQVPLGDLCYAMMVRSGNDAAVAVGEYIDGNVDKFIERMNRRAAELGMNDTHFSNPNGLPDDTHVSTAFDLALLAREAMKHDEIRQWVKATKVDFPVFGNRTDVKFESTNHLLEQFPLANGIKTGYTNAAGFCLVSSATYRDKTLIAVVLGCERDRQWPQTIDLFDYGFSLYDSDYASYREVYDRGALY
ncbi:MAG TPA: D-alanyl-D-alanine carboxypeptidase family protein [bacterium]|jgi:D-alanyl-D-alanine carboxypeptidase (penicillin-binding protein 5/6)